VPGPEEAEEEEGSFGRPGGRREERSRSDTLVEMPMPGTRPDVDLRDEEEG
jgi:hypothetical protein